MSLSGQHQAAARPAGGYLADTWHGMAVPWARSKEVIKMQHLHCPVHILAQRKAASVLVSDMVYACIVCCCLFYLRDSRCKCISGSKRGRSSISVQHDCVRPVKVLNVAEQSSSGFWCTFPGVEKWSSSHTKVPRNARCAMLNAISL